MYDSSALLKSLNKVMRIRKKCPIHRKSSPNMVFRSSSSSRFQISWKHGTHLHFSQKMPKGQVRKDGRLSNMQIAEDRGWCYKWTGQLMTSVTNLMTSCLNTIIKSFMLKGQFFVHSDFPLVIFPDVPIIRLVLIAFRFLYLVSLPPQRINSLRIFIQYSFFSVTHPSSASPSPPRHHRLLVIRAFLLI